MTVGGAHDGKPIATANSLQSCPTLHDPIDDSPPGSLSLVSSRQEYWSGLPFPSPMHACMLSRFSHVQLCATLWTAAHQAPVSIGFSRQEYWSGLPFPSLIRDKQYKDWRKWKDILDLSIPTPSYLSLSFKFLKIL